MVTGYRLLLTKVQTCPTVKNQQEIASVIGQKCVFCQNPFDCNGQKNKKELFLISHLSHNPMLCFSPTNRRHRIEENTFDNA